MADTGTTTTLRRQSVHALFSTAISTGLGLALSLLVARSLGPAGKGVLDLASATVALFALVLGGSLNAAVTHLLAQRGARPVGLIGQLAWWAAGSGLLTAVCLTASPVLASQAGLLPVGDHGFWIGFVALSVAVGIWAACLRGLLFGQQAVIAANRIDLAAKATLFVGFAAIALRPGASPEAFAIAGLAATTLLALALLLAQPGRGVAATGIWRSLLNVARPVHGTNILHFLNQRADVFFVQAFHGAAQVGLYALAVSLAQFVLLLSSALAQPLLPEVSAARSAAAAVEATLHTCRLFIALGVLAALALAAGSSWLLPLVFGRDFSPSLFPLLVLLPGVIGFGLTHILVSHFIGRNRSHVNGWISLVALAVTVVGNFTLTRSLGALGAALTSTLAYGLAGGLSLWIFHRDGRVPFLAAVSPTAADWREAVLLVRRFHL